MNLTDPLYHDADKAREHLEKLYWPHGPVCPHCGVIDEATKLQGKSTRKGVYKCNACSKPFSVTVGTVMEDSKIPLNKWVFAFALVNGSKKGFSAHQLHRSLGITYKSAWFMHHRIREAMRQDCEPMGGEGCDVEADETFIGKVKGQPRSKMAIRNMNKIVSLVDRSTGRARSFVALRELREPTTLTDGPTRPVSLFPLIAREIASPSLSAGLSAPAVSSIRWYVMYIMSLSFEIADKIVPLVAAVAPAKSRQRAALSWRRWPDHNHAPEALSDGRDARYSVDSHANLLRSFGQGRVAATTASRPTN